MAVFDAVTDHAEISKHACLSAVALWLLSTAQAPLPSHDVLACFELQMNSLVVSPACAMHSGVDGACYSVLDATSTICGADSAPSEEHNAMVFNEGPSSPGEI